MIDIRYVQMDDKELWYGLDRHLSESEFEDKVRDKRGYGQPMEMFLIKGI